MRCFPEPFGDLAGCSPYQSWADNTISMLEFEFPTGTSVSHVTITPRKDKMAGAAVAVPLVRAPPSGDATDPGTQSPEETAAFPGRGHKLDRGKGTFYAVKW